MFRFERTRTAKTRATTKYRKEQSVQAGAILAVGAETGATADDLPVSSIIASVGDRPLTLLEEPVACLEILGRTTVARMLERLRREDLAVVTVLVNASVSHCVATPSDNDGNSNNKVNFRVVDDVWLAVAQTLREYSDSGIAHAIIANATAYGEYDIPDLLQFHRERRHRVTRAFDGQGALDVWVVYSADIEVTRALLSPQSEKSGASSYFVTQYVSRLATLRHLRQFVTDVLRGRCEARPSGRESRPGVWIDEGAQLHKRARIVAPAYIGRGSKIREDTLVTRCSNIESHSCVDYGTVIEDSCILANSYVGIWLDVSHAVVRANKLLNLERNVVLEISDTSVIRENTTVSKAARRESALPVTASPLAFAP
jgi:NDP-sugar pyrophosphorylase family protein